MQCRRKVHGESRNSKESYRTHNRGSQIALQQNTQGIHSLLKAPQPKAAEYLRKQSFILRPWLICFRRWSKAGLTSTLWIIGKHCQGVDSAFKDGSLFCGISRGRTSAAMLGALWPSSKSHLIRAAGEFDSRWTNQINSPRTEFWAETVWTGGGGWSTKMALLRRKGPNTAE